MNQGTRVRSVVGMVMLLLMALAPSVWAVGSDNYDSYVSPTPLLGATNGQMTYVSPAPSGSALGGSNTLLAVTDATAPSLPNVMRFDDTAYRILGENLEALTRERDLIPDTDTYGQRSTVSMRTPGALVRDLALTL